MLRVRSAPAASMTLALRRPSYWRNTIFSCLAHLSLTLSPLGNRHVRAPEQVAGSRCLSVLLSFELTGIFQEMHSKNQSMEWSK